MATIHNTLVHGLSLSPTTQCTHYSSALDIIAIKHYCCKKFYACIKCHSALAIDHAPKIWPRDQRDVDQVVLCGKCGTTMTIDEYLGCGNRCPGCAAGFNEGCGKHYHLYFEM